MTETPLVTRLSGGLIVGLLLATPLLLGAGLFEAKWATSDVWWAETTFFATWLLSGFLGWYANDLIRMARTGTLITGLATLALPLLHLLLFGQGQSLRGTPAAVNLSLLLLGVALLAAATQIRKQSRSAAITGSRLASLPSGGPTRSHAALAAIGAVLISGLLGASASLLTSGTPLERIVVGVLVAPATGLPVLFWGLFAIDTRGCARRLSSLGILSVGVAVLAGLAS